MENSWCNLDDTNNEIVNPKRENLTCTNKRLKKMFVDGMGYTKRNNSIIRMKQRLSAERLAACHKEDNEEGDVSEEPIAAKSAIPEHGVYLRSNKQCATPAQLYNMKKENIRVDEVANTCSHSKVSHWNSQQVTIKVYCCAMVQGEGGWTAMLSF